MENKQKTNEITVELTDEQYKFLTDWQKTHEQELGIEVPLSSMVRKAVDIAMKSARKREERPERPERDDKPRGRSFDKPGGFKSGPRKPFGAAPRLGTRGPKFKMLGSAKKFEK